MPHDRNSVEVKTGDRVLLYATVTDVFRNDQGCNVNLTIDNADEPYHPSLTMNTRGVTVMPGDESFAAQDPATTVPKSSDAAEAAAAAPDGRFSMIDANAIRLSGGVYAGTGGVWAKGPDGHTAELVSVPGQTYFGLRRNGNDGPNDLAFAVGDQGAYLQIAGSDGQLYHMTSTDVLEVFAMKELWKLQHGPLPLLADVIRHVAALSAKKAEMAQEQDAKLPEAEGVKDVDVSAGVAFEDSAEHLLGFPEEEYWEEEFDDDDTEAGLFGFTEADSSREGEAEAAA